MIEAQELFNGITSVYRYRVVEHGDPKNWPSRKLSFAFSPGAPIAVVAEPDMPFDPIPFEVLEYEYVVYTTRHLRVEAVECHNMRLWERVTAI